MARKKDEAEIVLGKEYRDILSDFQGVAVSRHEYVHGCTRIGLQMCKDGDIKEYMFDAPGLEAVVSGDRYMSSKTGGPRPAPAARLGE